MQKILLIFLAIAALAGGVYAQRSIHGAVESSPSLDNVTFPDLEGKPHSLSEWKGKIIVVNFWATWCPPCVEEIPEFVKLQDELRGKGVQFIGVLTDDDADAALDFLKSMPLNYPVLNGAIGGREWSSKLGNKSEVLPFSALFDGEGRHVHSELGKFTRNELLERVNPLIK